MYVLLTKLARLRHDARLPRGRRASCQLRHVDAGSCNGCEHELQAAAGPQYDLARFGFSITASPRHADVLLVTGPITTRMVEPLRRAYASMPEPRLVAALGDCPLGTGPACDPRQVVGALADVLPVDIRIPGCPPSPGEIAEALDAGLRALRSR
ncbi:MAG: oxidoreductase [Thermoleophilia bacterium]